MQETREQFLADLLTTVVESPAIAYWARCAERPKRDVHLNVLEAVIEPHDGDTWEGANAAAKLDPAAMERGLARIADGAFDIGTHLRGYILAANAENDGGLDAEAVDCIVQAAVFGEIVYG